MPWALIKLLGLESGRLFEVGTFSRLGAFKFPLFWATKQWTITKVKMCQSRILTVHWKLFSLNKNTNKLGLPGNLLVALSLVNFYLIVRKTIKWTIWRCLVDVSQHYIYKWVIRGEADRAVKKQQPTLLVHFRFYCCCCGGGGAGGGGVGRVVGGGGRLFKAGHLLNFPPNRMGTYSRWVL